MRDDMEIEADRIASCAGKEPLVAGVARDLARRMRRRKGVRMHAYRCTFCGAWHVGERS